MFLNEEKSSITYGTYTHKNSIETEISNNYAKQTSPACQNYHDEDLPGIGGISELAEDVAELLG